jgi:adenylate kinase
MHKPLIIVFIGPPYAGKDTQGKLLSQKFGNLPIFSMGHLIREAQDSGNETIVKAYEDYSLKGLHLPTAVKFPLLKEKMDQAKEGFILDNFPATKDDLTMLNDYLLNRNEEIARVIYLHISKEETRKRFEYASRGRRDDHPEIIVTRREIQNQDRILVLEFYKNKSLLTEINGEGDVNRIHEEILAEIERSN